MSYTLQPQGLKHTRLPCPSSSPRACSNSYPLSGWFHPTISSSIFPFSSCLQFFPSGSFPISWFFASGGQSIGASALASVFPMDIQGSFPLGLTGLISLQFKGLSKVYSSTTVWKHLYFGLQPSLLVQPTHLHMTTGKTIVLTIWTFVCKMMPLLFNTLSRFVIASLVAQMVKNLPVMQETWVWSLGLEDLLEKGMATDSSILAWRISSTEEPGRLLSMGIMKSQTWPRD